MRILLLFALVFVLCYANARPAEYIIDHPEENADLELLKGTFHDYLEEISKTIEDCLSDIYSIFDFMTSGMWAENIEEDIAKNAKPFDFEDPEHNEVLHKEMEMSEFQPVLPIPPENSPYEPEIEVPDFSTLP